MSMVALWMFIQYRRTGSIPRKVTLFQFDIYLGGVVVLIVIGVFSMCALTFIAMLMAMNATGLTLIGMMAAATLIMMFVGASVIESSDMVIIKRVTVEQLEEDLS